MASPGTWGIAVSLAEKIFKMGAKLIGGDADEAFENIREKKSLRFLKPQVLFFIEMFHETF